MNVLHCKCGKSMLQPIRGGRPRIYCEDCAKISDSAAKLRWRTRNRKKCNDNLKKWRFKNREKCLIEARLWKKDNRKTINKNSRHRYQTDPIIKLKDSLRRRLHRAIRGNLKTASTEKLTGCSFLELKKYVEDQFVPGMTWENYGPVWHVDHIRPCASFDFSDPAQQRECFNYKNLQPLFAEHNRKKGDSWIPLDHSTP